MRSTFSVVIDAIFTFFALFTLFAFNFNYFIAYPFYLILSFTLSALGTLTFLFFINKKTSKAKVKLSEKRECEEVLFAISLLGKTSQSELFFNAAQKKGDNPEKKKNGVFLSKENKLVFLRLGYDYSLKAEIVKAFNALPKNTVAVIYTEKPDIDSINFAKRFDNRVILRDGKELFSYLKSADALPKRVPLPKKRKKLFSFDLQKKKAKRFLAFGFLFLLFSRFVPIKIYYVVFGCLFLLFGIILILFGKTAEQT